MGIFDWVGEVLYDGACVVRDVIQDTAEYVENNPGKAVAVAAGTVAAVATAGAAAPAIAAAVGKAGLLGAASTGTAISSLNGAALTSASLAKMGAGAKAVGGFGMAGGEAVISTTGGILGGTVTKKTV